MINERGSTSLVWLLAGSTKADYYLSPAHLSSVEEIPLSIHMYANTSGKLWPAAAYL